jgi:hypothetical protein
MTPEGKVKKRIKEILDACRPHVYYHMPMQNGMGAPTLDFVGCCAGMYFTIEAKAPGAVPTARQNITLITVCSAGGKTFVIDGDVKELKLWLKKTLYERLSLS